MPNGIPTVPEMMTQVLKDAGPFGKGLTPMEMTEQMCKRWWPEMPGFIAEPVAWSMYHRGQLVLRMGRYSLPSENLGEDSGRALDSMRDGHQ
jgi:hypothetical protein